MLINPDAGAILNLWSNEAQKHKYAVNLEPKNQHRKKNTFNGVYTTTQKTEDGEIYPLDYLLPENTMKKKTKVTCNQIFSIPKSMISYTDGQVTETDLKEIRKRAAKSIGYEDTTS